MIFAKTGSNDAPMLTPYFHSYMFLDRHRSYELGFVRPSVRPFVRYILFFSQITNLGIFQILYMPMGPYD